MHTRHLAKALISAVSLTAVIAGSACSSGGNTAQTDSGVSGGDTSPISVTGEDRTTSTGSGVGGSTGRSAGGGSAGTARAQLRADALDDTPVPLRIDVVRLQASGELVNLELNLTNELPAATGGAKEGPSFQANTMFGDGNTKYDASAIGLVDPTKQKLYLPVYDSNDKCLCTGELGAVEFAPGGTYTLTGTYGGVPRDVTTLDVRVPSFPTIVGVRIER